MGLRDYLAVIGRRLPWAALGFGGVLAALTVFQVWSGSRYTAEASLSVGPDHPMADVLQALVADRPQMRVGVPQVVRRLWDSPRSREEIAQRLGEDPEGWEIDAGALVESVSLSYEREEQRYAIRATASGSRKAVTLANVTADALSAGIKLGLEADLDEKLAVLRDEYDKRVKEEQEVHERLDVLRRQYGLLPEERTVHEAVDRLRGERRQAEARAEELQTERVRLEDGQAEPPDTPQLTAARARAATLEEDLKRLTERYTEAHPLVRISRDQLAEAQAELARLREEARRDRLRALEGEQSDAVTQSERLGRKVSDLLSPEAREDVSTALSREESLTRTVGEVRRRLDEWSRHKEMLAEASWVAQRAQEGRVSVKPWFRSMGLYVVLALLVGVSFAFVREVLDDTVANEHHLQRYANLECVGAIPETPEAELFLIGAPPTAPLFEQFSRLGQVLTNRLEGRHGKILLVTSPKHDDGKTTISVDLAIALAALGRRTVLVDADLHRPTLHALFGQPAVPGLSTFLEGRLEARAFLDQIVRETSSLPESTTAANGDLMIGDLRAIQELQPAEPPPLAEPAPAKVLPTVNPEALAIVARATQVENLKLVTAGAPPANPAGLVDSAGCEAFLQAIARDHDVVVVDSSPSLGTSPPLAIARRADLVLLVTRAGYTRRDELQAARRSLLQAGAKALVGVLNAARKKKGDTPYYYYARETPR